MVLTPLIAGRRCPAPSRYLSPSISIELTRELLLPTDCFLIFWIQDTATICPWCLHRHRLIRVTALLSTEGGLREGKYPPLSATTEVQCTLRQYDLPSLKILNPSGFYLTITSFKNTDLELKYIKWYSTIHSTLICRVSDFTWQKEYSTFWCQVSCSKDGEHEYVISLYRI